MFEFWKKSLYRSPIKNLLFIILFLGITAFCYLQVSVFQVTNNSILKIENNYPTLGIMVPNNTAEIMQRIFYKEGTPELLEEEYNAVIQSGVAKKWDIRRGLAAHAENIQRLKEESNKDSYLKCKLLTSKELSSGTIKQYELTMKVIENLTAPKDEFLIGEEFSTVLSIEKNNTSLMESILNRLKVGEEYYLYMRYLPDSVEIVIDTEMNEAMIFPVAEKEKFEELFRYDIEVTLNQKQMLDAVFSSDIMMIPYFNSKKIDMVKGRIFSEEEYLDDHKVCIISQTLAQEYGLEAGDKIQVGFSENYMITKGGITASPVLSFESFESPFQTTEKEEYEIVGLYVNHAYNAYDSFSFSDSTIFFPMSSYDFSAERFSPFDNWVFPFTFSFILKDSSGREQLAKLLEEKGMSENYSISYEDNNFQTLIPMLESMQQDGARMLLIASFAGILIICLLLYFYVVRQKTNYAVMRILGTPKRNISYCYLFEMIIPAFVGGSLGCIFGSVKFGSYFEETIGSKNYGIGIKGETMQDLFSQLGKIETNSFFSGVLVLGIILILLGLGAGICLKYFGKKQPLQILSDAKK